MKTPENGRVGGSRGAVGSSTIICMSDHLAILTTNCQYSPKAHTKPPHKVYRYKAANFDALRADMETYTHGRMPTNSSTVTYMYLPGY